MTITYPVLATSLKLLLGPIHFLLGPNRKRPAPRTTQRVAPPFQSAKKRWEQELQDLNHCPNHSLSERLESKFKVYLRLYLTSKDPVEKARYLNLAEASIQRLFATAECTPQAALSLWIQQTLRIGQPERARTLVHRVEISRELEDPLCLSLAQWYFTNQNTTQTRTLLSRISVKTLSKDPKLARLWMVWQEDPLA